MRGCGQKKSTNSLKVYQKNEVLFFPSIYCNAYYKCRLWYILKHETLKQARNKFWAKIGSNRLQKVDVTNFHVLVAPLKITSLNCSLS